MFIEKINEFAMAAAGQAFLAGLGVSPEAFDTRIDTGSDSPVFRRWLGPAEVAVQVFFDPRVNLTLWEGEPRGFMIKPFIAWPRLDFSSRELVIIKPYTKLIK